jgi:hypothetical protein
VAGSGPAREAALFSLPRALPQWETQRIVWEGEEKYGSDFIGERGGTRTLDPMIKSHVLYRLSYALTCRAV